MRSYYNGGVYRLSFKRKNNFMHLAIRRVLVATQFYGHSLKKDINGRK